MLVYIALIITEEVSVFYGAVEILKFNCSFLTILGCLNV